MSLPATEIVVVERGRETARALVEECRPTGAHRHVLCQRPDEDQQEFATRVLRRVSTLRRQCKLANILYIARSADDDPDCVRTTLLSRLVQVLKQGTRLELVCCRAGALAWWTPVNELVSLARVGVTVSARMANGSGTRAPLAATHRNLQFDDSFSYAARAAG